MAFVSIVALESGKDTDHDMRISRVVPLPGCDEGIKEKRVAENTFGRRAVPLSGAGPAFKPGEIG